MMEISVDFGGKDFLRPYFLREFPGRDAMADDITPGRTAFFISDTEIYDCRPDEWADEDAPLRTGSPLLETEKAFMDKAHEEGCRAFILRCAPTVCTGMQGRARRLLNDIYRGLFFHLPGNEARLSVVHGTDVAAAAAFLAASDAEGGIFNLTDGNHPSIDDLAEALAYRLDNKRISTVSTKPQQWFARLMYGGRRLDDYTVSALVSSAKIESMGFEPHGVCSYLRNHVYDDASL